MAEGVRIRSADAEKVKRELLKRKVLDKTKKPRREKGYVIFPVTERIKDFETVVTTFETQKLKKFEDHLTEFLSPEEADQVRTSFDIVGDIAIIEIPDELQAKEVGIAESLIAAHKNIKTVFKKTGEVKGRERLRGLKFLAGEEKTEAIHREHGCRFKVDVTRVYFSPRLSYERQRILEQTKDGEVIIDLFAGVGPFSIILAKHRDVKVYAIDINPKCYEYLQENIKLNKVGDKVTPLLGDCREVAPKNVATRVIMNLPKSSEEFLDLAFDVLKEGIIHFYSISPERDLFDSKIKMIGSVARDEGRKVEIVGKRVVRPYAPRRHHVAIDVRIRK
ncbi:MAG: class I SAM-dependent methyltransferase family protein [Candidatus Hydrothermarchaeales archaeon]